MKTVFLDLDHTLVHSTDARLYPPPEKYDFVVTSPNDETKVEFYVLKRPFVDEFLKFLSENFEIVVFTAGNKMYASAVIDQLDNRNLISHRLYRNSCTLINGRYVKDLSRTGRDMKSVVLVDDNPDSYELQPENGIPINQFYDDDEDEELNKLIPFFQGLDSVEDVRDAVKVYQAALYGEEEVEDIK
ncbi:hypothetical protein ACJIZ3_013319 [Penstemon smallii]|uniref:FCP1 homology domain-containing protein n=1 Tax=Penstemon smallii TaxID=265156 RepID=A0ABD3UT58_9LAMI